MRRISLIANEAAGRITADIGCDHGYTGKYLLDNGLCEKVILTDISSLSLNKAKKLLCRYQNADFRCGSGLQVLKENEADCIIISGMGGREIIRILSEGGDRLTHFPRLILSPQSDVRMIREYILSIGYMIVKDFCGEENGKFYDIIVCAQGEQTLCGDFLEYGITNVLEPNEAFRKRLMNEIAVLSSKITPLNTQILSERIKDKERILSCKR